MLSIESEIQIDCALTYGIRGDCGGKALAMQSWGKIVRVIHFRYCTPLDSFHFRRMLPKLRGAVRQTLHWRFLSSTSTILPSPIGMIRIFNYVSLTSRQKPV